MKRSRTWAIVLLTTTSGVVSCRDVAHERTSVPRDPVTVSHEQSPGGENLPTTVAVFENPDGRRASFRVEIAATPGQRERGLMHRRELRADQGMVFVFPREERQVFWMKDTYLPLDMIFVDGSGQVVGVVENARPLTLDPRTVESPARVVVEIPAFGARKAGIGPGSRVRFIPPLPEVAR